MHSIWGGCGKSVRLGIEVFALRKRGLDARFRGHDAG